MEKEFDEALEEIGRLYESGKDCLHMLPINELNTIEQNNYMMLFEILRQFRDISALAYKKLNSINQN